MVIRATREDLLTLSSEALGKYFKDNQTLCELCGTKPAHYLLPLSFNFSCCKQGFKCRRPIPPNAYCAFCENPATEKMEGGLICSRTCEGFLSAKKQSCKATRQKSWSDPEWVKRALEKRAATSLERYGVPSHHSLPEARLRLSISGKEAHRNLSPEARERVITASGRRNPILTELPKTEPLNRETRLHVQTMKAKERRAFFKKNPTICEVCGCRMAYNILPASLVACCNNRADRCPGQVREGTVCFECGNPATTKTKSGLVCGSNSNYGCTAFMNRVTTQGGAAAKEHNRRDPAFKNATMAKIRNSLQERYGVTSVTQLDTWKQSLLEKYGVVNPAHSGEIKGRTRQRIREKYGVEHTSQLESTKEAFRNTCQERYGADNVSQSPDVFSKVQASCYRSKLLTLPSGTVIMFQGYEDRSILNQPTRKIN